jgi:hypothetical protein
MTQCEKSPWTQIAIKEILKDVKLDTTKEGFVEKKDKTGGDESSYEDINNNDDSSYEDVNNE